MDLDGCEVFANMMCETWPRPSMASLAQFDTMETDLSVRLSANNNMRNNSGRDKRRRKEGRVWDLQVWLNPC